MTDGIYLPLELLPREARYRPSNYGFWSSLVRRGAWLGFLWALLTIIYAIVSRFTTLPMAGTDVWYILFGTHVAVSLVSEVLRRKRAAIQFQEHENAMRLLTAGEVIQAGVILEELCGKTRKTPWLHARVVASRGRIFLMNGNHDQALSLFAGALHGGWMGPARPPAGRYWPELLGSIALCYALKNEMAHAEFWQGIAHDQTPVDARGALAVLDTVTGIRNGRFAVIVKDAKAALEKCGGLLAPADQKLLRVLCAYALSQIDQNSVQREKIEDLLERAGALKPEEFDYLTPRWPEFGAFLAAHTRAESAPDKRVS